MNMKLLADTLSDIFDNDTDSDSYITGNRQNKTVHPISSDKVLTKTSKEQITFSSFVLGKNRSNTKSSTIYQKPRGNTNFL